MDINSWIEALTEQIKSDLATNATSSVGTKSELSFTEIVYAFIESIDWTEPWLITLLSIHVFLTIFIFLTRRRITLQVVVFLLLLGLVYTAELLNTWCSQNYHKFTTVNYFDKNGGFISFMYSFPLLLNATFALINLLLDMARTLIKLKRAQLLEQRKQSTKKTITKETKQE